MFLKIENLLTDGAVLMYSSAVLGTQDVIAVQGDRKVQTFIVSDNALIRMGLSQILEGTQFHVAETASGQAAVPPAAPGSLAIIHSVNDVAATVERLKDALPESFVVAIMESADPRTFLAAHAAGAHGVLLSGSSREVMIKSLELVTLGETVMPSSILHALLGAQPALAQTAPCPVAEVDPVTGEAKRIRNLSPREMEILGRLKEGEPNKIIARELDVTEATVKVHVKAILRKIGAANRTQAAMWAASNIPAQRSDASVASFR